MRVYHMKKDDFFGTKIYPLNQLKSIAPEKYRTEVKKYSGRKELMDARIPLLDCLWNDVIHLSPVDNNEVIKQVMKIFEEHGLDTSFYKDRCKNRTYFRIDTDNLDHDKLFVFLNLKKRANPHAFDEASEEFLCFEKGEKLLSVDINQSQIDYILACAKSSPPEKPLLWKYLPHVLYKGTIDVNVVEEVKFCL